MVYTIQKSNCADPDGRATQGVGFQTFLEIVYKLTLSKTNFIT